MKKFLILLLLLNNLVLAQNSFEKVQTTSFNTLLNIIKFVFSFFMLLGSALLIYLGIKYITATGKVEELHKSLVYLILGIIILITSFFIPNLIKNFIESVIS